MDAKFRAIVLSMLIWPLFAGCNLTEEPPEPLDISGHIILQDAFLKWTMTKVIVIDSGGAVVSETVPVLDGTNWKWQMPILAEDGEDGVFWVEMTESPGKTLYYNEGTPEKFEHGKNITLNVNANYIPIKSGNNLGMIGKNAGYPGNEKYILIRDVKLGDDWTPLCESGDVAFSGTLSGNGHTVSGLKLADTGNFQYVGLFGYLDGAKIEELNLVITNTVIDLSGASEQGLGALAGFAMNTSISGVEVSGPSNGLKVRKQSGGNFFVGGIAGKLAGTSSISRSATHFSIEVDADSSGSGHLGGIAGQGAGSVTISECYNAASVTLNVDGVNAFAGGILGFNENAAEISQCYATGNVSVSAKGASPAGTVAAGGLVGGGGGTALAGTRSCALMDTVSASSLPSAALTSSGGLLGVGALSAGTESCYQLNTMTITPDSGMDAGTVVKSAINVNLFIGAPLNWNFASTWVWDGLRGYPVFR